jgi:adenosylcobinamide kinase / adenosylcobinamide-phosphate guanylyltransferase
MGTLVFVLGGARSGKSVLLEDYATRLGPRIAYVATSLAHGRDMVARIAKHAQRRPPSWTLHESPHDLVATTEQLAAASDIDGIVLECLYMWTVNQLGTLPDERDPAFEESARTLETTAVAHVEQALASLKAAPHPAVITSNECGLGIAPERRRQRVFRDLLGRVNEVSARAADRAFFVVAGHAIDLTAKHVPVSEWGRP